MTDTVSLREQINSGGDSLVQPSTASGSALAKEEPTANRRQFLGTLARVTLLSITLAGTGSLMARRGRCAEEAFCRDCAAFAGCRLSQATRARDEAKRR